MHTVNLLLIQIMFFFLFHSFNIQFLFQSGATEMMDWAFSDCVDLLVDLGKPDQKVCIRIVAAKVVLRKPHLHIDTLSKTN